MLLVLWSRNCGWCLQTASTRHCLACQHHSVRSPGHLTLLLLVLLSSNVLYITRSILHVLRVLYMAGPTHIPQVWPTEEDLSIHKAHKVMQHGCCQYRLFRGLLFVCCSLARRFLHGAPSIDIDHCAITGYMEPQPAVPLSGLFACRGISDPKGCVSCARVQGFCLSCCTKECAAGVPCVPSWARCCFWLLAAQTPQVRAARSVVKHAVAALPDRLLQLLSPPSMLFPRRQITGHAPAMLHTGLLQG